MSNAAVTSPVSVLSALMRLHDADLARVLRLAQTVVPGLGGEQALAMSMRSEEEEAAALCSTLNRHWRQAYIEAGPHYAALRCWGLAIWQPIYLSVIAVHLDTHVPRLRGLTQPVSDGFPQKFCLPMHEPMYGTLFERMQFAVDELQVFCQTTLTALMPLVGLHVDAADRLQAECVLGALLLVQRYDATLSNDDLMQLGEKWLTRLRIANGCSFFAYRARDGTTALALDRKVCCHHFRRHDGEKCSTCPKLSLDTRIARLLVDQS